MAGSKTGCGKGWWMVRMGVVRGEGDYLYNL